MLTSKYPTIYNDHQFTIRKGFLFDSKTNLYELLGSKFTLAWNVMKNILVGFTWIS